MTSAEVLTSNYVCLALAIIAQAAEDHRHSYGDATDWLSSEEGISFIDFCLLVAGHDNWDARTMVAHLLNAPREGCSVVW